jgi:hypothetical protein
MARGAKGDRVEPGDPGEHDPVEPGEHGRVELLAQVRQRQRLRITGVSAIL